MSKHAKKLKRADKWAGGKSPEIDVDDEHGGVWLYWAYRVAPFEVRVDIQLEAGDGEPCESPWLFVDGNDDCLDDEASQSRAEAQYGAMTRVRLLEAHADEIRTNAATGLATLRDAATRAGLFGKRERRHCMIPTWTTDNEKALRIAG